MGVSEFRLTCKASHLGFQSESTRHNLEAPIRLSPTPPALELRRNRTNGREPVGRQHWKELTDVQQRSWEDLLNIFTCSDLLAAGVELNVVGG